MAIIVTKHARERHAARTRGWMLVSRAEEVAQDAWDHGEDMDQRASDDPNIVRKLHDGYVHVFAEEGEMVTLITMFEHRTGRNDE